MIYDGAESSSSESMTHGGVDGDGETDERNVHCSTILESSLFEEIKVLGIVSWDHKRGCCSLLDMDEQPVRRGERQRKSSSFDCRAYLYEHGDCHNVVTSRAGDM